MGILGRLSHLIKSNVNDVIDSMQDPGKEIDQLVRDMEDSAREARREVSSCMAQEKLLAKRVDELRGEAQTWEDRAATAVQAGDDALAKEALRRKAEKDADRLETEKALQEQAVQVENLTVALKTLDVRVKDVKLRQGSLRDRARNARGDAPLSTKTSAFNDFDRMSGKIDAMEAEATLTDELGGRTAEAEAAERKLNTMSEESTVDEALAALKKKLDK